MDKILDLRLPFKLPEYCCIFQVEVLAVRKVAKIANNVGSDIKNININVNSQVTIKAIISPRIAPDNSVYILGSRPQECSGKRKWRSSCFLLTRCRKDCRTVVGLITGYNYLVTMAHIAKPGN